MLESKRTSHKRNMRLHLHCPYSVLKYYHSQALLILPSARFPTCRNVLFIAKILEKGQQFTSEPNSWITFKGPGRKLLPPMTNSTEVSHCHKSHGLAMGHPLT